ncbi:MAG: hypothetical protein ACYTBS_05250 [Planctomycetota bacterium]
MAKTLVCHTIEPARVQGAGGALEIEDGDGPDDERVVILLTIEISGFCAGQ